MEQEDNVRAAALAEIRQLQADIAQNPDPREARLRKLEKVVSLLADDQSDDLSRVKIPVALSPHENAPKRTKTEIIADAAERFLKSHPGWQTASAIYYALDQEGIEIGGQNPKGNLTAHMSSSGRFISDRIRGRGWRLKSAAEVEKPGSDEQGRSVSSGMASRPFLETVQQRRQRDALCDRIT